MKINKLLSLLLIFFLCNGLNAQNGNSGFRKLLESSPEEKTAFCVNNEPGLLEKLLREKQIKVKSVTPQFIYIQATPKWVDEARNSKLINWFYFETGFPQPLADTARARHFVDQVHNGQFGLPAAFTGKDVVIGYIDQGLDYTHPDFIDENGQTRVLFYWDHTLPVNAQTPPEYGYGQVWNATEIQNGTSTSTENSTAHGTTVAGMGSGNGRANGTNKGMAPDSKIIVVETNFNLPNWTLTIADAIEFIFTKAADLGLPAVVNLSVGDYLGSHDGDDPASVLIESMLDASPGRIVVSAAGNSGNWGKYHVHNEVDADTSFTWFQNNPSSAFGPNKIYFDLWAEDTENDWEYAVAANLGSGSFQQRGTTVFRAADFSAGTPVFDTIWNGSNRIATVELYPDIVGNNYHLEVFFSNVDSTSYYYSFKTKGTGSYDLWSGATLGLNNIVTTVPSAAVLPQIIHYVQPDAAQTIVSSWNCSEKVISVANMKNRFGHVDNNGNYYQPAPGGSAVGELSVNSSKGPSRHNLTKPDITAGGDGSLSAAPMWLLNNSAYNSLIDSGGWHARNGGTSMASPVVAGIAALYLEKCHSGTYATFKTDMITGAVSDGYTGTVPNNSYGNGKIHALNLMLESNYSTTITSGGGATQLCSDPLLLSAVSTELVETWGWSNSENTESITISTADEYSVITHDFTGCVAYDTISISQGDVPAVPVITLVGNQLETAPYPLLQWFEDGVEIPGATGSSISISLPVSSSYTVEATGMSGCTSVSDPFDQTTGLEALESGNLICYPNPFSETLKIEYPNSSAKWTIVDIQGKNLMTGDLSVTELNVSQLASGSYFLEIIDGGSVERVKIVKN